VLVPERPVVGAGVPRFEIPGWDQLGVHAGVTGRGSRAQPFDLRLPEAALAGKVADRWHRLLDEFPGYRGAVVGRQVHGTEVRWHGHVASGVSVVASVDGHATATAGLLLTVSLADCVPIYLADPGRRAIALLHAGWRGTAGEILRAGIEMLEATVGSRPADLVAHLGVGICGECYEVGGEVLTACGRSVPASGKGLCDLRGVQAEQARRLGIGNISASPRCSAHEHDCFFSHRASLGQDGRMVAYLGIMP